MAQKLQDIKDQLSKALRDPSKPWTALFDKAERSGVDRLYIFIGKFKFFPNYSTKLVFLNYQVCDNVVFSWHISYQKFLLLIFILYIGLWTKGLSDI